MSHIYRVKSFKMPLQAIERDVEMVEQRCPIKQKTLRKVYMIFIKKHTIKRKNVCKTLYKSMEWIFLSKLQKKSSNDTSLK